MNKKEITEALSSELDMSQAAVGRLLDALGRVVGSELSHGRAVNIPGFGSFKPVHRQERRGRNPRTGEAITVAASVAVKFAPALALKETLNPK